MRRLLQRLALAIGALMAPTATFACLDGAKVMTALAAGDWSVALAFSDECAASEGAKAPAPPVTGWDEVAAGEVLIWLHNKAVLNAKLGRHAEAQRAGDDASDWARRYGLDASDPVRDLRGTLITMRGYLAEQRGDLAEARQHYAGVVHWKGDAQARLALLALDAGDNGEAARLAGDALAADPGLSTALYVLGLLAERRGTEAEAHALYRRAMVRLTGRGFYNPGSAVPFVERDRIMAGLERLRR